MAERVMAILADAKRLAQEYRALTGERLGSAGEVAEFEAARIWSSSRLRRNQKRERDDAATLPRHES